MEQSMFIYNRRQTFPSDQSSINALPYQGFYRLSTGLPPPLLPPARPLLLPRFACAAWAARMNSR